MYNIMEILFGHSGASFLKAGNTLVVRVYYCLSKLVVSTVTGLAWPQQCFVTTFRYITESRLKHRSSNPKIFWFDPRIFNSLKTQCYEQFYYTHLLYKVLLRLSSFVLPQGSVIIEKYLQHRAFVVKYMQCFLPYKIPLERKLWTILIFRIFCYWCPDGWLIF